MVEQFRDAALGRSPLILLDGQHLITEALAAGCHLTHLCVGLEESISPHLASLLTAAVAQGTDVIEATSPVMGAVSPVRSPSSIVALADRPDSSARLYSRTPAFIVIACDMQDPGNLGAIVRVAEGAGATGVVTAGACADAYGWKALRGSMGSALRFPIASRAAITAAIDDARAHGCRVVATVPRGGTPFYECDLTGPIALLIGGEGGGLSPDVIDDADERVTIPMTPPVESLNAAVATALVVYEARRQRS